MISIKECGPYWPNALSKHLAFLKPRISSRIDYYIKLLDCIDHGRTSGLNSSQFITYLKTEFNLDKSSLHSTFRARSNRLFNSAAISNKNDYIKLLGDPDLRPDLANLHKMKVELVHLKGQLKALLSFEFKKPYQNYYRELKLIYLETSSIAFLYDEILNYADFSSLGNELTWGPYQLLKSLEINVCPYCNRQYTFTVLNGEEKIVRPDLDHFLPKGLIINKLLQVSFFNLIPSCGVCNQRLKNRVDVCYSMHLNPYESNPRHKLMRFDYVPQLISGATGTSEEFKIEIKCDSMFPSEQQKVRGNIELFRLELIYNQHKDIVHELDRKSVV